MMLSEGRYVIENAQNYEDLNRFTDSVLSCLSKGKKFLFQTSASAVKSLTQCETIPYIRSENKDFKPGLVIIGSHVKKTTQQLNFLKENARNIYPLEIEIEPLLENSEMYFDFVIKNAAEQFKNGKTPLLYTSRKERTFSSVKERLSTGEKISGFLTKIVHDLPFKPSYIIAKGGITSHDIYKAFS